MRGWEWGYFQSSLILTVGQPGNEATIYLFIKHMIVIILVMQILHLSSLVELVTVGWWPTPC